MPASRYYCDYVSKVWELCDEIYLKYFGSVNDRAVYHQLGISVIESMISEFDNTTGHPTVTTEEHQDELARFLKDHTDIGKVSTEVHRKLSVPTMTLTPPETLYSSHVASPTATSRPQQPQQQQQQQQQQHRQQQRKQASHLREIPSEDQPPATVTTTGQTQKPDSSDPQCPPPQCHLCDYRPNGDPRWFKGSMAKHMKVKHSDQPDKIYPCTFP
ncbi:hypothetical protein N0V85_007428, partial [Neurospora sp. IMI 360204]